MIGSKRTHVCSFAQYCKIPLHMDVPWASLVAQMVRRLSAMQETRVQSLGWEDPLEKEMAAHSSILAWKIPWISEPGRLRSMRSQRVGHDWATSLSLSPSCSGAVSIEIITANVKCKNLTLIHVTHGGWTPRSQLVVELLGPIVAPLTLDNWSFPLHPTIVSWSELPSGHLHLTFCWCVFSPFIDSDFQN